MFGAIALHIMVYLECEGKHQEKLSTFGFKRAF